MPDWKAVSTAIYKDPSITYLNAGSISVTPRVVFEQAQSLRERLHANPVDYVWRWSSGPLWQARCRLAQFVGTTPERLIFTQNVSQAINFIAQSILLPRPGEIVMTNHEYGAMRWAWERAGQRLQMPVRQITLPLQPESPAEVIDAVVKGFGPQTRLLFISHILYTIGIVLPIKEICAAARKRGILTVIDGAHGPGMIPLRLDDLGADFYATNLHKWFMAPGGSGFLYVAPGLEDRIQPWQVSWGWKYDRTRMHEREPHGATYWQRSYEFEGTRDLTPWLTVGTAADFLEEIGQETVLRRVQELSKCARSELQGKEGLQAITPEDDALRGGLTAFRMPTGVNGHRVRGYLWNQEKIEINMVDHPDGPFFRLSTHVYNLPEEIEKLVRVLPAAFAAARAG